MTETGYGHGEGLILTLVQGVDGFSAENTSRADWGVLNSGKSKQYAILRQDEVGQRKYESPTMVREPWVTVVEVWRLYEGDGTTYTALLANVEAILSKIDQYPHMDDTTGYVEDSTARISSKVLEMWKKAGNGPKWLKQEISVAWDGRRSITFLD